MEEEDPKLYRRIRLLEDRTSKSTNVVGLMNPEWNENGRPCHYVLREVKTLPGKVDVTQRALRSKGMNLVIPRDV